LVVVIAGGKMAVPHGQPMAHLVGITKKLCGIFAANSAD